MTLITRASLLSLLLLAAGCSTTNPEPLGSSQQGLYANDEAVYKYFVDHGLTNFQSAGVVGNLDQESHVDPTIHQFNGGVGRGLAQWSAGARWDTTPGQNVKDFAAQKGKDIYDLGLQLDFIWFELENFDYLGFDELKASTTLEQATQVFEDKYEGCVYANYPECALPSRVTYAKAVFDAFGDYTGPSGTGGSGGGGAGGTSAGTGGTGDAGGGAGGASGGTSAAGSAGTAAAGTPSAGAPSTGSGGLPASGGAPGSAGSVAVAGSSAVAGAPSNGGSGAGTSPVIGLANTSDESGCSFAPAPSRPAAFGFALVALSAALGLRRRRGDRATLVTP
jgi:hypothetical protein